jgi:hypothetical protein
MVIRIGPQAEQRAFAGGDQERFAAEAMMRGAIPVAEVTMPNRARLGGGCRHNGNEAELSIRFRIAFSPTRSLIGRALEVRLTID